MSGSRLQTPVNVSNRVVVLQLGEVTDLVVREQLQRHCPLLGLQPVEAELVMFLLSHVEPLHYAELLLVFEAEASWKVAVVLRYVDVVVLVLEWTVLLE